jgi:hypothetical protein
VEEPVRNPKSRGSHVLLLGLTAGFAVASGVRASAEGYAPPRHDRPPHLARAAVPAALLSADPLCGSSLSGVVILDRDVSCGSIAPFLESGATLDLGGFTFEGSVQAAGQGVALRNGTVVGGPLDFSSCEDCLLEDLHVQDGVEFTVQPGPRNVIRSSRFSGNDVAVDIYYGAPDEVTVRDCEFEDNGYGVNIAAGSRNRVLSNTFLRNRVGVNLWNEDGADDDIDVNDNTISDNHFAANRWGVVIEKGACAEPGCLEGNRVVWNAFFENLEDGLLLPHADPGGYVCVPPSDCDLSDLRIEHNRFEASGFGPGVVGGDGLDVSGPPQVTDGITLAHNAALANADLGIETPGVIDGGSNRARENGNPLQCVGVVCELLVDIALKKWDPKRLFHARSHRPIAVVLFGSPSFDLRDVDVRTLAFGPDGAPAERVRNPKTRDENDDGFADGVFRFRNHETGIAFGDREVCLTGETRAGQAFGGCAAISMGGACGLGFELALVLPPLLWIRRSGALRRRNARGGPA